MEVGYIRLKRTNFLLNSARGGRRPNGPRSEFDRPYKGPINRYLVAVKRDTVDCVTVPFQQGGFDFKYPIFATRLLVIVVNREYPHSFTHA